MRDLQKDHRDSFREICGQSETKNQELTSFLLELWLELSNFDEPWLKIRTTLYTPIESEFIAIRERECVLKTY